MNKKENIVYKGIGFSNDQKPDKETIGAYEQLYRNLVGAFGKEEDFTNIGLSTLNSRLGRYTDKCTYSDGWRVGTILVPDISSREGEGYHKITVVACTAQTHEGIIEATKRAAEVRPKAQRTAQITNETTIVLSPNIPFKEALKNIRRGTKARYVYSVKNATGVVKNALNTLSKFFDKRAEKLGDKLRETIATWGENIRDKNGLDSFVEVLSNRVKELKRRVDVLAERLQTQIEVVKQERKANKIIPILIRKAQKLGMRFGKREGLMWVDTEDRYDLNNLKQKFIETAERQGIDWFWQDRIEADRVLNSC